MRALATAVARDEVTGTDVTEQFVDAGARARNLEGVIAQLTALLHKAATVDESLRVHRDLVRAKEERGGSHHGGPVGGRGQTWATT